MIDLASIQQQAIELVKVAGDFIRNEAKTFSQNQVEEKGFNDLVSYVDKEAEKILVEGLLKILPEAGFVAEEGTSNKVGEVYNWIVDPLDGTTNFIHGLPVYSVSVALERNHEIIAGIVYEINRDECFHAYENDKAYLNDQPIKVSADVKLSDSLVATGFPYYDFEKMDAYLSILKEIMQNSHGLRRMGSAAVDLAYVACGRFEGFFEYNLNAWDVAAGAFIVKQAGGEVSTFQDAHKEDYVYGREILAAAPLVHNQMYKLINEKWTQ